MSASEWTGRRGRTAAEHGGSTGISLEVHLSLSPHLCGVLDVFRILAEGYSTNDKYRINENQNLKDVFADIIRRLVDHDQLIHEIRAGNVFQGFMEPEILFRPTYRFVPNTTKYYADYLSRMFLVSFSRCVSFT